MCFLPCMRLNESSVMKAFIQPLAGSPEMTENPVNMDAQSISHKIPTTIRDILKAEKKQLKC